MTTTLDQQPSSEQNTNPLTRALAHAYTLNWEAITYVVILITAVFTRFFTLGERVMSHDESLHTRYSYNLATEGNFQHTPLMHGPVLFHMTALFYFLFGANDFTSRIYPALLGVLVVMMPLLFRRWLGKWGAILASIMLLISPITLYYNRYIRHDTPNIFFSLVMIYSMFMYLSGPDDQRRRTHWLYIIAGAMLLNLGSKETAFIYIFIIGVYLALYWFVRLAQRTWRIPGKTTLYTIVMAFGVGGVAALGMFATLSINLGEQPFFDAISTLSNASTFIAWTVSVIIGITLLVGASVWAGFRGSDTRLPLREGVLFFALSFVVTTVMIIAEEISRIPSAPEDAEAVVNIETLPVIVAWVVGALIVGALVVMWRRGGFALMRDEFPEFDLIVLIGSLILPWAAPFVIKLAGVSMEVQDINSYTAQQIQIVVTALIPFFAVSLTAGLLWDWKKWLVSNAIFYALFAFFFTTMFTNPNGVATGLVGSLGYWLEQQGVRRGNQPQYYYVGVILPMYEYLPIIGSVLGMGGGLTWFWRFRRNRLEEKRQAADAGRAEITDDNETDALDDYEPTPEKRKNTLSAAERLDSLPFLPFVAWWGVLNLVAYTLAGEKMPWLAIHMALPMILVTAWYFGRLIQRVSWRRFTQDLGWVYLLLVPLSLVLIARVIAPFIFGNPPLVGLDTIQLQNTGQWLAVVAVLGLVALAIYQLIERTGLPHFRQMMGVGTFALLAVLTFRAAWMASFINYDLANEYLVYAHAAPAVKTVLNDIEDLSRRTTDGMDLQFVYDNEVSWPYSWYFREFNNATFTGSSPNAQQVDQAMVAVVGDANRSKFEPLLEDRFYRYEYIRLWWPMQDYFGLTPSRLAETVSLTPSAAQVRRGLWDIWWARDYTAYGNANDRSFALTEWPVADRMHVYVRKDFASQVWNLGVGEGTVPGLAAEDINVCNANWTSLTANQTYGDTQPLANPIGMSVDGNRLYVAEQGGGQISIFDTQTGERLDTLGTPGTIFDAAGGTLDTEATAGLMERPNSVAAGPDRVAVVDTWNFRVQIFDQNNQFTTAFGERYERGADAQTQPVYGFWGPRDAVINQDGHLFIADTGNRRIRVYDENNEFLYDIGESGSGDGQLNEPAGLALHSDGRLYIADTWNRRVSVFDQTGAFLYAFRVRAWYTDRGNRPYLAIDEDRGYLYITDPEAGRVLVTDLAGNCVGSFGQAGEAGSTNDSQLAVAGGITLDADGNVYVSDAASGRVLRFEPFPLPEDVTLYNDPAEEPVSDSQDADSDALNQGADSAGIEGDASNPNGDQPQLGQSGGGAGGADNEISVPLNPVNVPGEDADDETGDENNE